MKFYWFKLVDFSVSFLPGLVKFSLLSGYGNWYKRYFKPCIISLAWNDNITPWEILILGTGISADSESKVLLIFGFVFRRLK